MVLSMALFLQEINRANTKSLETTPFKSQKVKQIQ